MNQFADIFGVDLALLHHDRATARSGVNRSDGLASCTQSQESSTRWFLAVDGVLAEMKSARNARHRATVLNEYA